MREPNLIPLEEAGVALQMSVGQIRSLLQAGVLVGNAEQDKVSKQSVLAYAEAHWGRRA